MSGEARIIPYLYYEDVAGALAWLANAFGLTEAERVAGPGGRVHHAEMRLGHASVMMGGPGPDYRSPKNGAQATSTVYVEVDDIEAHYANAQRAGATIIEALADQDYGARRYGAEDLEGQHWYFAQPVRVQATSA